MGHVLSYIAIILFTVVYLLDGIIILIKGVKNRKWYYYTSSRSRDKAFKTDIIANWLFPETWNLLFSNGGYEFGRFGESLSSALGKKYEGGSLSIAGLVIYGILYIVDVQAWKKGGHCYMSIMDDDTINKFIDRKKY